MNLRLVASKVVHVPLLVVPHVGDERAHTFFKPFRSADQELESRSRGGETREIECEREF